MREKIEALLTEILQKFTEAVYEIGEFRGQRFIILKSKEYLLEIISFLKERGFNHLQTLTAVDYFQLGKKPRFEVVYQLCNIAEKMSLRIRVPVEAEAPEIDSIVSLYPSANFLEREVYDLFGITFKGHPNLKRILLPENWEGHPLRKDYPLAPEEKPKEFLKLIELKERLERDGIR